MFKACKISVAAIMVLSVCACSTKPAGPNLNDCSVAEIIQRAEEEKYINSVAMPDTWANWSGMWEVMRARHGLAHTDLDMNSVEELSLFAAEKNGATKDIGDVGIEYGKRAKNMGVTQPYRTSYWEEIPAWAKDDQGHWIASYMGTMAFLINDNLVDKPPSSWNDLLYGDYKISIGDVMSSAQAQYAVVAAAIAMGGSVSRLQPGIDFWKNIAQQGRLDRGDSSAVRVVQNQVAVACLWDFNALNYRENAQKTREDSSFTACIPKDGTIRTAYATIINAYAPHPHAAALVREYILSDEGQIQLAKGYATPIRKVEIPEEVKSRMIPPEQYVNVQDAADVTTEITERVMKLWKEQVLPFVNSKK